MSDTDENKKTRQAVIAKAKASVVESRTAYKTQYALYRKFYDDWRKSYDAMPALSYRLRIQEEKYKEEVNTGNLVLVQLNIAIIEAEIEELIIEQEKLWTKVLPNQTLMDDLYTVYRASFKRYYQIRCVYAGRDKRTTI
jgi:hypothetical protein